MGNTVNTYYCEKCNRTLNEKDFYSSHNLQKYPNDGKLNMCKKCLTMHVDNWNPDTYLWILQEIDVPYIPEEWNKLMASYARDPSKVTGTTIVGRYLSKMKLKQFKDFRWKDNDFLQELAASKMKQAMERQGYEAAEIAAAIDKASYDIPEGELVPPPPPPQTQFDAPGYEDYFAEQAAAAILSADELGLTEEEVTYLRMKWGKSYKPEEWVQLEQLYEEMMGSYDIQTAGHKDTLKLICKTSLKANQLVDVGDVEGFQKMSKVYDTLMKSGKFTAAQNKAAEGQGIDSISELVAICERDGFIPRYYTDGPQDKIDRVIQDMQDYTRTLITEEMHLGSLIERAIKQIEDERARGDIDEDEGDEDELFEQDLFDNPEKFLGESDLTEFNDFEDEEEAFDNDLLESLLEDGDY